MRKNWIARRTALLLTTTIMVGGAISPWPATAQTTQQTYPFNIAAKPIRQGLSNIGRITGLTVVFSEKAAASETGKSVSGALTAGEALDRLLSGTGLSYRFTNSSTITISCATTGSLSGPSDGSTALETITVSGGGETAWGPVNGIVARRSATGTKSDTPLVETPRSISVVTKEEIQARGGAQNYIDALPHTPGFTTITSANTRSNSSAYLRGFSIFDSLYLDGMFETGALEGLNLGAGVRYVGSSYGDNENTVLNGSATYLDLSAGCDFGARNSGLEGLRLEVSVLNVADRKVRYCDGRWGCQYGKRLTALGYTFLSLVAILLV